MRFTALLLGASLALGACSEREVLLPGERIDVRPQDALPVVASADGAVGPVPISLPAQVSRAAWPMRVGDADNDPGHARLSGAPQPLFATRIGSGDSRRQRIATDPVSDGRLVFTMDSQSMVTATSAGGGKVWSASLVPSGDKARDAAGGGLAVVDGTLFATTGYGRLHALDAATGARRWTQRLDAPVTAPKAQGGRVYVVSRDNRAWSLDADTGRIRWDVSATPATQAMATAPAPALTGRLAILPFASAEVVGALADSGLRAWGAAISGERAGVAYNDVGDITGDPVVANGTVYAGTAGGRIVAIDPQSGERVWTAREGAISPMAVAGGAVFAVTDRAQLVRMDAATGEVVWRADLPFFRNDRLRRRKGIYGHHGPVLAGGRLWVASGDGQVRGFDPASGAVSASLPIAGGAASRPIVVGDVMYVVSRKGLLHAYR
ncbi:PQQ-like beta-propeller repeat protein [Jannaschia sp. Os4]|uniref:outer membrane protein assembly factor BamB family protein n=1 Tax=Jannaschia sp. Os4 TaxID=2807617 RepID=UPI00193AC255|nr:PQQ-like beta-propeller repeat protein [Jannaschia sp. Os4]MBM2577051.1 PQQ-like beta-propeller repeat protein [Jannaschia sp. Os4]